MRKSVNQIKEGWIEDIEYGTLAPTEEVVDAEDFKEKLKAYGDAQAVKEMSLTRGWFILKRELMEEAARRGEELLHYGGDNDEKLKKINKGHLQAKYARDWVIQLVEGAKDVPRPVQATKQ